MQVTGSPRVRVLGGSVLIQRPQSGITGQAVVLRAVDLACVARLEEVLVGEVGHAGPSPGVAQSCPPRESNHRSQASMARASSSCVRLLLHTRQCRGSSQLQAPIVCINRHSSMLSS